MAKVPNGSGFTHTWLFVLHITYVLLETHLPASNGQAERIPVLVGCHTHTCLYTFQKLVRVLNTQLPTSNAWGGGCIP